MSLKCSLITKKPIVLHQHICKYMNHLSYLLRGSHPTKRIHSAFQYKTSTMLVGPPKLAVVFSPQPSPACRCTCKGKNVIKLKDQVSDGVLGVLAGSANRILQPIWLFNSISALSQELFFHDKDNHQTGVTLQHISAQTYVEHDRCRCWPFTMSSAVQSQHKRAHPCAAFSDSKILKLLHVGVISMHV